MKKGFTLVEVLVAIFIFVLILIAAYQVYERSQKTYILGEQLADLQQNIRFAYEQISYDLRRAGYNVYPDDESKRPDEQIEGMWSSAIAIRADFDEAPAGSDYCCKDTDGNKMCDSGTGNFLNVSTRNSEIRIYALAKKPNDPSGQTIRFLADLSKPRNAFLGEISHMEKIEIPGVAINQNNPPYTLYRITIDENATITDGQTVPSSALVWTPLASNIYSLQFTYYNEAGINPSNILPPDPTDLTSLELDYLRVHGFPFGATPSNFAKYVEFSLKGVTQNPDPRWVDSSDPYQATKNKRKVELKSTIVLKNVGVAPHELADTVPPDAPTELDYTDGYCNGVLLTWKPSLALDVTAYYVQVIDAGTYSSWGNTFKYNCDDWPSSCYITSTPEVHYGGRIGYFVSGLQYNTHNYARVFSQDRAGNLSMDATNTVDFFVKANPIKPNPPALLTSFLPKQYSNDELNLTRLFVPVSAPAGYDNSQTSACKEPPLTEDSYFNTKVRDLYGYRLYHKRFLSSAASDFSPAESDFVASESQPNYDPFLSSKDEYPDILACPCEYYAYKVKAATTCATYPEGFPKRETSCNVFLSDFSDVSKEGENPKAYFIPEHQDFNTYPQIVPGKPEAITPMANEISPENYQVSLKVPVVLSIANRKADGTYEPISGKYIETWRYKIYKYNTEEDANNDINGVEILDTNISGEGDLPDWDAGVDGGLEYIKQGSNATFTIGNFNIPHGEKIFFRVRGYYRCADGANEYLGQLSDPVPVPCNLVWTAEIIDPPFDYSIISGFTYPIKLQISGLPAGVTISSVVFSIPTPYGETYNATCSGTPTCIATFNWNNTAYLEGTYTIIANIVDSMGCSFTTQRIVVINRNCGNFEIKSQSTSNDNLTYELRRLVTTNVLLLKRISFSSSGNYLYENINFYESDPNSGSPTPFNLWSGTAQNMDGKWIGKDQSIAYNQSNFCGYLRLYPDPSNSTKQNWFKINFDKNITSSNGPLNLMGSFTYKLCDGTQSSNPFNIGKNQTYTYTFNMPVCSFTVIAQTGNISVSSYNYCTGSITLGCKTTGNYSCTAIVTVTYPSTEFECINVPIFPGP